MIDCYVTGMLPRPRGLIEKQEPMNGVESVEKSLKNPLQSILIW